MIVPNEKTVKFGCLLVASRMHGHSQGNPTIHCFGVCPGNLKAGSKIGVMIEAVLVNVKKLRCL